MAEFEYNENDGTTRYYDKHTLSLIVYKATYEQVAKVIENAINQTGIKCAYKINLIEPRNGLRYAYVRLSEPSVYYAMVGLNYDGTERSEWVDDPDFKMPEIPLEEALKNIDEDDWADISFAENEVRERYVPQKIKKELEPLVTLIPYDEQGNDIDVMRAFITLKEEPYENNVIFGMVPSWVTYSILSPYFDSFVTDKQEKKQTKNGTKNYPLIRFVEYDGSNANNNANGNRNGMKKVYITFSEANKDANFCLLMNRFIIIEHNGKHVRLVFDHCKKSQNENRNGFKQNFKPRGNYNRYQK